MCVCVHTHFQLHIYFRSLSIVGYYKTLNIVAQALHECWSRHDIVCLDTVVFHLVFLYFIDNQFRPSSSTGLPKSGRAGWRALLEGMDGVHESYQGSEGAPSSSEQEKRLVWQRVRESHLEIRQWLAVSRVLWALAEGNRGAASSEMAAETMGPSPLFGDIGLWITWHTQAEESLMTWLLPGTMGNSICSSWAGSPTQDFMKVDKGCVENS